jgi:hypothetical protein
MALKLGVAIRAGTQPLLDLLHKNLFYQVYRYLLLFVALHHIGLTLKAEVLRSTSPFWIFFQTIPSL